MQCFGCSGVRGSEAGRPSGRGPEQPRPAASISTTTMAATINKCITTRKIKRRFSFRNGSRGISLRGNWIGSWDSLGFSFSSSQVLGMWGNCWIDGPIASIDCFRLPSPASNWPMNRRWRNPLRHLAGVLGTSRFNRPAIGWQSGSKNSSQNVENMKNFKRW